MAKITLDVGELPGRTVDVAAWLESGDTVVVTTPNGPAFRLIQATRSNGTTPTGSQPRVLGMHPGTTMIGPDFNDPLPESWADEPA